MKKTVLKTAVYTFVFALACIGLVFCVLSLFCPMTMSDMYFKTGSNRLSARYAVVAAERSGDASDYAVAVERSFLAGNHTATIECGTKLLQLDEFSFYAGLRDEAEQRPSGSYADYVGTMVVTALYRKQQGDEAIALATALDNGRYGVRAGLTFLAVVEKDQAFARKVYDSLVQNPASGEDYDTDMRVLKTYLGIA